MNLSDLIALQNPWWHDPSFIPQEYHLPRRMIASSLLRDVTSLKQITSLTGLRRTGKSTLLKQCIGELLKTGVSPQRILYFSFDQPTVLETPQTIEALLTIFFTTVLKEPLHRIQQPVYIVLDEVQLIPMWQDIIKRYYDLNQKLKFIISGSAALFLSRHAKESLAGRLLERQLPPLSFAEYQQLGGKGDFNAYLTFGQFPELLEISDTQKKIEYLKDGVIGKILEVDIVKTHGIRKIVDFERLFWSLLPNAGQIIRTTNLMADLAIKKATLFTYLNVLEQSLLIHKVVNISGSFRSEKPLLRKLSPASTNFLALIPEPVSVGFMAETYAAMILKQRAPHLFLSHQRDREIDFIVPEEKLAIEIKYQSSIRPDDCKTITSYITKKGYQGIVFTKYPQPLTQSGGVRFIPLEDIESCRLS